MKEVIFISVEARLKPQPPSQYHLRLYCLCCGARVRMVCLVGFGLLVSV